MEGNIRCIHNFRCRLMHSSNDPKIFLLCVCQQFPQPDQLRLQIIILIQHDQTDVGIRKIPIVGHRAWTIQKIHVPIFRAMEQPFPRLNLFRLIPLGASDSVMVAYAIKNRFCARDPLTVAIPPLLLVITAVIARVQSKGNVLTVVIDIRHHTVPQFQHCMHIRKMHELQWFVIHSTQKGGFRCGRLDHKRLHIPILFQDIRNRRKFSGSTKDRIIGFDGDTVKIGNHLPKGFSLKTHNASHSFL